MRDVLVFRSTDDPRANDTFLKARLKYIDIKNDSTRQTQQSYLTIFDILKQDHDPVYNRQDVIHPYNIKNHLIFDLNYIGSLQIEFGQLRKVTKPSANIVQEKNSYRKLTEAEKRRTLLFTLTGYPSCLATSVDLEDKQRTVGLLECGLNNNPDPLQTALDHRSLGHLYQLEDAMKENGQIANKKAQQITLIDSNIQENIAESEKQQLNLLWEEYKQILLKAENNTNEQSYSNILDKIQEMCKVRTQFSKMVAWCDIWSTTLHVTDAERQKLMGQALHQAVVFGGLIKRLFLCIAVCRKISDAKGPIGSEAASLIQRLRVTEAQSSTLYHVGNSSDNMNRETLRQRISCLDPKLLDQQLHELEKLVGRSKGKEKAMELIYTLIPEQRNAQNLFERLGVKRTQGNIEQMMIEILSLRTTNEYKTTQENKRIIIETDTDMTNKETERRKRNNEKQKKQKEKEDQKLEETMQQHNRDLISLTQAKQEITTQIEEITDLLSNDSFETDLDEKCCKVSNLIRTWEQTQLHKDDIFCLWKLYSAITNITSSSENLEKLQNQLKRIFEKQINREICEFLREKVIELVNTRASFSPLNVINVFWKGQSDIILLFVSRVLNLERINILPFLQKQKQILETQFNEFKHSYTLFYDRENQKTRITAIKQKIRNLLAQPETEKTKIALQKGLSTQKSLYEHLQNVTRKYITMSARDLRNLLQNLQKIEKFCLIKTDDLEKFSTDENELQKLIDLKREIDQCIVNLYFSLNRELLQANNNALADLLKKIVNTIKKEKRSYLFDKISFCAVKILDLWDLDVQNKKQISKIENDLLINDVVNEYVDEEGTEEEKFKEFGLKMEEVNKELNEKFTQQKQAINSTTMMNTEDEKVKRKRELTSILPLLKILKDKKKLLTYRFYFYREVFPQELQNLSKKIMRTILKNENDYLIKDSVFIEVKENYCEYVNQSIIIATKVGTWEGGQYLRNIQDFLCNEEEVLLAITPTKMESLFSRTLIESTFKGITNCTVMCLKWNNTRIYEAHPCIKRIAQKIIPVVLTNSLRSFITLSDLTAREDDIVNNDYFFEEFGQVVQDIRNLLLYGNDISLEGDEPYFIELQDIVLKTYNNLQAKQRYDALQGKIYNTNVFASIEPVMKELSLNYERVSPQDMDIT